MGTRGCAFRLGIHRAASITWGDPLGYHFNDPLRPPSSLALGPITKTADHRAIEYFKCRRTIDYGTLDLGLVGNSI